MKKKLISIVLALVLVFGLAVPAFADGTTRPTAHTAVTSLDGVSSVTVNGTAAYYEYDSNTGSSVKYIRAELPKASATEYSLKTATVVITTTGSNAASIPGYTASVSGNQYTFTGVNLFNTAYTVSVGSYSYTLAAGIEDGRVGIGSCDPLRLSGTLVSVTADVYGSNQNNPYMGNPYYSTGWTFISYFVTATLPANTALNNVTGSFTIASGASFSGPASSASGPFNFTSNNIITITNGSASRQYSAQLAVSGQSVIVQESAGGYRNYDINLTELKASSYYTGDVKTKADAILTAWNKYISTPRTFPANTKVMGIMENFISWAVTNEYFDYSSDTSGGTYLSQLNGLNASDCGYSAGYMYADDPQGYYWNSTSDHSQMATIGADQYVFTDSTRIVWFYTVDFMRWFNWF